MGQNYRLVGSQDPSSHISRAVVEPPSAENPDGKYIDLDGDAVELTDDQVIKLSSHVRLERVEEGDEQRADFGPHNYPEDEDGAPAQDDVVESPDSGEKKSADPGTSEAVESITAPATPAESTQVSRGQRARKEA